MPDSPGLPPARRFRSHRFLVSGSRLLPNDPAATSCAAALVSGSGFWFRASESWAVIVLTQGIIGPEVPAALVIPALDEEDALGAVLASVDRSLVRDVIL